MVATETAYDAKTLARLAAALWLHDGTSLPSLAGEQPGLGPLASPAGLTDCLTALGVNDGERAIADFATYNKRPVAVIVTGREQASRVYVVDRSCRLGNPQLVAGPVDLLSATN